MSGMLVKSDVTDKVSSILNVQMIQPWAIPVESTQLNDALNLEPPEYKSQEKSMSELRVIKFCVDL